MKIKLKEKVHTSADEGTRLFFLFAASTIAIVGLSLVVIGNIFYFFITWDMCNWTFIRYFIVVSMLVYVYLLAFYNIKIHEK